ncbi:MAG TPA: ethylbenzene dehydrogenase-related protein [Nitrospinota bacterium]|nr:ethylbenzene dehydrogenase-related protein [Nitrospinota bacterium]
MRKLKVVFFNILVISFFFSPVYALEPINLESIKVDSAPKLDGDGSDSQWKNAKELKAYTDNGPKVFMKSVYTDQEIFLLIQFEDETESIRPDQWVFDGEKWSILQEVRWAGEEPWEADNDMLGMHWPIGDSIEGFSEKGCKQICHAPEKEDKMYTNNPNEKTDIWLWKSGITNPLGYADSYYLDNSVMSKEEEKDRLKRINLAHKGDDLGPGNLNYLRNEKNNLPEWMPNGAVNGSLFLFKGNETPFDPSKFKKGDAIAGWVLARPKGSRGFINAKGKYNENDIKWVIELSRTLVTDDKEHDVQFDNLKKVYYFGLAIWDNEKLLRHTRIKEPVILSFK